MTARLTIRPSVYRGRVGFSIRGTDPLGRRVAIHADSRPIAERIRDKVRSGGEVTFDDFTKETRP